MTGSNFDILGACPADLAHPGLALAVARAGGLGLLDFEFVSDAVRAKLNFDRLLAGTTGRVGLRVSAPHVSLARELLHRAGQRPLTLVLCAPVAELSALREACGLRPGDRCLAEILNADDAPAAESLCDGLVARGHEAGGWVGEDSSFILMQKLRTRCTKPVFIQGGIGVRSAAACRAAGAAGVVLDDSLLFLAESPLPANTQAELSRLNGAECKLFGELLGTACRVFARPGNAALKQAEEILRAAEGGALEPASWAAQTRSLLGWQPEQLCPVGQSIGLAATYREQFRTVGRLILALRRASLKQIDRAAELAFIDADGALARSHGTRYPVAQGPMTRVSDSPAFAVEVANAGALPFLALALLRGPQIAEMLAQTRAQIGDRPWGVGLLGFIPQALRDEQCAEIWKCKPTFALIAGGRPDQSSEFEQQGIRTYIHAPAPALLKLYLEQGARRFVFEGRECGGHVGPLASFPLWEQMIEVLLADVPASEASKVHVLFAGGIHDAASSAMVASMAAPLAERGMKVGVLMGTAYLFTQEIVASGAVVQTFQDEALRCARTMNLESGPGHASRCVDTRFAHEFYDTRRRLIREGKSVEEIRDALEDLNLGRLRIASKGVQRDEAGRVAEVPVEQQRADGMYMIGQVATMRDQALPIAALHEDVTSGAQALLDAQREARLDRAQVARPSDIAIVGIGVTLPQVNSADDYWKLILDKTSVIREVPHDRWDPALFYDADPKARDKVYSKWGGFLDEVPFDPLRFGIPPKSMKSIDALQLLTLETASRTLADAGYADGQFDRENTSVILGAGGGAGDLGVQYSMRSELPRFVENPSADVWDRLPEWTEESFAGTLLNVAAGRVANRLDFGGVNFTIDAACGSSLAAISIAVSELESGRSNLVLAGGIDTTQSAFAFMAFAKTQALSAKGEPRTFDQAADGIAISEGVAMVALKRLADAEADGDRIYAVIKSAAGSSDGKALGLTAPRSEGQVRALNRAYAKAGFSPATLGLVEAHGTGTPVGDRTEAQTIVRALNEGHAAPRSVALGSVKTLLGHTKAAAGVSGLIKVALSLYHRVLPAHHGVDRPIDTLADPNAPVYLLKDARPWVASADHPRRGAASAFGFGGTNFHAVLEEYRGASGSGFGASGGNRWTSELLLFRAPDVAALTRELEQLLPHVQPGSRVRLGELAAALVRKAEARRHQPVALALVAGDLKSLAKDLAATLAHLQGGTQPLPPSARFSKSVPAQAPALAFLFPGQGAQYLNMGREAALFFPEVREALELADQVLAEEFRAPLSSLMLPPAAFDADAESVQSAALTDTRVAQPAIGALSLGFLRLAERLGIEACASAGHSYGEYTALMAAGVLAPDDFLRLSAVRGRAMAAAAKSTQPGGMAAVLGARERIASLIAGFDGVRVANHNSPEQTVISGPRAQVEAAVDKLGAEGLRCTVLPVSGAFHTELVAPAKAPLSTAIHATPFQAPRYAVYSNSRGTAYPAQPEAMRELLDAHLLSTVEFVAEIEAMYAAGCRVFLELGPKGICSGMARQTLAGRDAVTVSLDAQSGKLRGTLLGLAELFVAGVPFDANALVAARDLQPLDFAKLPELGQPAVYPKHFWMVSGGCSRPIDDPLRRTGILPALTRATSDAARAAIESRLAARAPAASAASPMAVPPAPSTAPVFTPPASGTLSSEALVAYQQTMRQFLSLQERVIQQVLGSAPVAAMPRVPSLPAADVAALAVPAPSVSAAPAAVISTVPPPPSVEAAEFDARSVLLGIVSERTGYPTEMLALDADLEADLGIDSIKRVEILGALRKALPAEIAQRVQAQMERFTKARSLSAILSELGSVPTASAAAPVTTRVVHNAVPSERVDLRALLLGIVSERTGYPVDMLDTEADLEADLGIDSIKRVEILGALRKALPADAAQRVQAQMERFTKARSLDAILAALGEAADAGAAPVAVGAVTAPAASAVAPPSMNLQTLLLNIVSERTGYPAEMLALDADLEADLGIDSIKRVEILGALLKALPSDLAQHVQGSMERFTKARSLDAILAELAAAAPLPETAPIRTVVHADRAPGAANEVVVEDTALPRFVIKSRPAPLSGASVAVTGLALVLGGPANIADGVLSQLLARGIKAVHIADADDAHVRQAIAASRAQQGPVRALLHLHGLDTDAVTDIVAWRGLYRRQLLSLFHALQACLDDLPQARVIAASRLGGSFGRDAVGTGQPIGGGVNGMLNCLRVEVGGCQARALDFDGQTDADIARLLALELFSEDAHPEAGYIGLERYTVATHALPLSDSPFPARVVPDGDWVLLATGGARGITAEIIEELVRPGMRVVLLGRTAEPAPEDASLAPLADAAALRKAVLDRRLARGDKPRPVEIDREVSRVLVDREIRGNLARLRAAGATVDYLACDVRDDAALGALIDALYARHGRIDAVLHGAGVIEDRLLADKTADSFERVLGTKLDPAFVFANKLRPESLKLLAYFTSVAGRYGNRGQTDYAAANEALNRCAWDLHHRWPQTRVVAVNWGPWDAGMASEGVKRQLRERGMEPIPVAAGRRFFLDELARGPRNEVELVAGQGPWADLAVAPAMPVSREAPPSRLALLHGSPKVGLGGAMLLEHRLSLATDPYLGDHRIDGQPVLPLAMGLEYMAQFAAAGWPEWQVAEVRDLRALSGLALDAADGRELLLRARAASHSEPGAQAVTVEILDARRKDGASLRATLILLPELPVAPAPALAHLARGQGIDAAKAYAQHLHQGDCLRALGAVHRVDGHGADAEMRASTPLAFLGERGADSSWLFDPALIDGAAQLSFLWARLHRGKGTAPVRIGRVRRFGFGPVIGTVNVAQRVQPTEGDRMLRFNAEYVDDSGQVRLLIEDGESAMRDELNRLAPRQRG